MTGDTKLPPYLPYPRFLMEADLTQFAKLLYAVLLDRANLSLANGWQDDEGQIYIVFPVCKIANAVDRSPMTVKNALTELETVGLIERRRQGFSQPNRIYVKIPDGQDIVLLTDKKLSHRGKETCPTDGQKAVPMTDRKLSPNNMSNNNLRNSNLSGVREHPPARGRYENVFLTEAEVAELQADFPTVWQEYIERLSEYMASTGKTYKSHAATIRRWAKEDRRKGKGGICGPVGAAGRPTQKAGRRGGALAFPGSGVCRSPVFSTSGQSVPRWRKPFAERRDIYGNHQTHYPPYQQGGNHRQLAEGSSGLWERPG